MAWVRLRAELLVQVPLVRLDGVHGYGQLAAQTPW
jgi:hypothetical protein